MQTIAASCSVSIRKPAGEPTGMSYPYLETNPHSRAQGDDMAIRSFVERQQAIDYIKARICRLSERKSAFFEDYQGPEGHLANQVKVIDWKIDALLETLGRLTVSDRTISLEVSPYPPSRHEHAPVPAAGTPHVTI